MIRLVISLLAIGAAAVVPLQAQEKPPAGNEKKPEKKADPATAEEALPAGILNFFGKVTGTVEAVDPAKSELRVKVSSAVADPEKNKALKPESLAGMTVTITPLAKPKDGVQVNDEASVAFIRGARVGDPVTLDVRASSKGVVFRLLKVPVSGGK